MLSLLLDGEVTLAELSEDYEIELEVEDVVTIAGLALAQTNWHSPPAGRPLRGQRLPTHH